MEYTHNQARPERTGIALGSTGEAPSRGGDLLAGFLLSQNLSFTAGTELHLLERRVPPHHGRQLPCSQGRVSGAFLKAQSGVKDQ